MLVNLLLVEVENLLMMYERVKKDFNYSYATNAIAKLEKARRDHLALYGEPPPEPEEMPLFENSEIQ
jgi:hypothetical protein